MEIAPPIENNIEDMKILIKADLERLISKFSEVSPDLSNEEGLVYNYVLEAIGKEASLPQKDEAKRIIGWKSGDRAIPNKTSEEHIINAFKKSQDLLSKDIDFDYFKKFFNQCFFGYKMRPAA
jgi:hypothetical protein